jgi:GSCFA family
MVEMNSWKVPEKGPIALIGSCFSDELKIPLQREGYEVYSNPFGTLFHPIPIFNWLERACKNSILEHEMQLEFHEGSWKSLQGGKMLRRETKEDLVAFIQSKVAELNSELKKAKTLVITIGTAHAWIHNNYGVVGNCQRLPQQVFQRKIIPLNDMIQAGESCLEALNKLNSRLRIVLTVSPVKHWRMGVVENNRTKARIIELVHTLKSSFELDYFPSYEIVTDVLRNDEYFEFDRCHPNKKAIEIVADYFLKTTKGA